MEILVETSSLKMNDHGSITGVVFVSAGSHSFPEKFWNDFPVVVLSWWLEALEHLSASGSAVFAFMDGPYEFRVRRVDQSLSVDFVQRTTRGEEIIARASADFSELVESVENAARTLLEACDARGWNTEDVRVLDRAVNPSPN